MYEFMFTSTTISVCSSHQMNLDKHSTCTLTESLSECIGIIQFDLISPWKDKHFFYQVMTGLLYTSDSDEQTTLVTTGHTKMDNEDVYARIKAIRETVTEINFEIAGFKRDLNKALGR